MCSHTLSLKRKVFVESEGPLDELDGLEGLVHEADGEVEGEIEHRLPRLLVAVLQTHKLSAASSGQKGKKPECPSNDSPADSPFRSHLLFVRIRLNARGFAQWNELSS